MFGALIVSMCVLLPGQSRLVLGVELAIAGLILWVLQTLLQYRSYDREYPRTDHIYRSFPTLRRYSACRGNFTGDSDVRRPLLAGRRRYTVGHSRRFERVGLARRNFAMSRESLSQIEMYRRWRAAAIYREIDRRAVHGLDRPSPASGWSPAAHRSTSAGRRSGGQVLEDRSGLHLRNRKAVGLAVNKMGHRAHLREKLPGILHRLLHFARLTSNFPGRSFFSWSLALLLSSLLSLSSLFRYRRCHRGPPRWHAGGAGTSPAAPHRCGQSPQQRPSNAADRVA